MEIIMNEMSHPASRGVGYMGTGVVEGEVFRSLGASEPAGDERLLTLTDPGWTGYAFSRPSLASIRRIKMGQSGRRGTGWVHASQGADPREPDKACRFLQENDHP